MNKLITDSGQVLDSQKEILHEIRNYYTKLYSSRDEELEDINLNELLGNTECYKLNDIEKQKLESPITKSEILTVLKGTKSNKSPGTSGFSFEFFKVFWKDLGTYIFRSFTHSYKVGELSNSQKLGIISILPKGNKSREYIKNWRPISLLNSTYKLFSGIIAHRLKSVLVNFIHENQKGFLPGRFIGENSRLLYDIMHVTEEENIPGLLLLLDFEKAFDSISWKFIYKVLNFFNFGQNFIKLIQTILNDPKLCVIQNGIFSDFFNIGRGCRQGDPASSYIFLLCVEILGIMIRKNKNIKGIVFKNNEYKLLQYADDTALLLDGTEKSLNSALSLINQYSKFSGLKPNFEKTVCIKIGSLKNSHLEFEHKFEISWNQEPFTFLGIIFSINMNDMVKINYDKKKV